MTQQKTKNPAARRNRLSFPTFDWTTKKRRRASTTKRRLLLERMEDRQLLAVLASWDFTGQNTVATSTAQVVNASLDDGGLLTRGTGAPASAGANSFRTQGFQNDGISTANTDYFQTTFSAAPGNALSFNFIDARFAGTATYAASPGVSNQFAYSLDGSNFTLIGSPTVTVGTPATTNGLDLTGVSALQNVPDDVTVTFRYYASGQTSTGGWGFNSANSPGTIGLLFDGDFTPVGSGPAMVLSPNVSSVSVTEGQPGVSFDLSFTELPTSDVTVTITPSNTEVDLGNGPGAALTLTFTAANATTPQSFVVTAVDDDVVEGDHSSVLTFAISSADNDFDSLTINPITVHITDNDFRSLVAPYSNDFEANVGAAGLGEGWTVYSVDADTNRTWAPGSASGNRYAVANAFGGTAPANDWLISPPFDLDATQDEVVSFQSWTRFTDTGFTHPQLDFLYSTDYLGLGDPTAATWTPLPFTPSPANSQAWTQSGDIDISGISGSQVWFAFQYRSSGTGSNSSTAWQVDDFSLVSTSVPAAVLSPNVSAVGVTEGAPGASFDLSFNMVPGDDVTVTITPSNNEVDLGEGPGVPLVLVFTPANAAAPQTFIVTAVDDDIVEGDHDSVLTFGFSSADPDFYSITRDPITVNITDNDFPPGLGAVPFFEDFQSFTAAGFAPIPSAGQLNSNIWRVTGMSDEIGQFGGAHTTGDFARGFSNGGVTTGGLYAFNTGQGNVIIGFQPTGLDFNPGALTLRVANETGATVSDWDISYEIWTLNDQGRASTLNFEYSTDDVTYIPVPALDYTTPEAADALPAWTSIPRSITIFGANVADGDALFLRWVSVDAGGSGSRDEFGIDNVSVTVLSPSPDVRITPAGGSVQVTEGGASDTFDVVLSTEPTADVTVSIAPTLGQVTTDVSSVVFTPVNWNVPQTVTVTAIDDDVVEGPHTDLIALTVSSSDPDYDGLNIDDLVVNITDNDFVSLVAPYANDFETVAGLAGLGEGWTVFSVDADKGRTWAAGTADGNRFASANAFGGTAAADDWLISPPFDLDATEEEVVTFRTWTRFTDSGLAYPELTLLYSIDFSGVGDPTVATWDTLPFTASPEGSQVWTDSGHIDISAISGTQVWFAFRYQSSGIGSDSSTAWRVDDFTVTPDFVPTNESSFVLLNEILFDIAGTDERFEYIELRGDAGTVIPANTYLVNVEGDDDSAYSPGKLSQIFDLSGLPFGSNGFLVLAQANSGYTFDPDANVLVSSTEDFGGFSFFQSDSSLNLLENATTTFMLISSPVPPQLTDDIDPEDEGSIEGPALNWTILDSVAISDGGAFDEVYSPVVFTYFNQVAPPLGYVARAGNSTGMTRADWIGAELVGTGPDFSLSPTNTEPAVYGGLALNHIGSANPFLSSGLNVDINRDVVMNPGQRITISSAILSASDPDTPPANLVYTVTAGPTQGTLTKGGVAITSFTQADLQASDTFANAIRYTTTGAAGSTDSITLSLTNGDDVVSPIEIGIAIGAPTQPISYSGGTYTQGFDDLLPTPIPADNVSIPMAMVLPQGWVIRETSGTNDNANSNIRVDSNTSTTGDTFLFGNTGSNERALGSLASGSLTAVYGAHFVNETGQPLNSFTLRYTGEQWRDGRSGSAVQNALQFSYAINATAIDEAGFTRVEQLDFAAPIGGSNPQTGSDVPLDGNDPANQVLVGGPDGFTVTGFTWLPGETFWIRWEDINEAGNDDALGIDNLFFSAESIAAPGLVVVESDGSTLVVEGGLTDTLDISLTGTPTANVTVTLTPSNSEVDLGAGAGQSLVLTFTPGTAGIPQTVTITAIDDTVLEGLHTSVISFMTTSADGGFSGLSADDVTVTIVDNDFTDALRLNEIYVNPPSSDDNREYVELISTTVGSVLMTGLWLLEIEGDGGGAGLVDMAIDLSGYSTGDNGLALIGENYETAHPWGSEVDPLTTLINLIRTPATMENGTITFLLVGGFYGQVGMDLDTNNDGSFNVTPWVSILDSVGWTDGGAGDRVYSPAFLTQSSGTPDAATRIVGNFDAESTAAWYNGGIENVLGTGFDLNYRTDQASANLPAGARLTPGAANYQAATTPVLSIAATDAVKPEGDSGTTEFTFTVTRSGNAGVVTTVDWAVTGSGDDPADADDFDGGVFPSGTLTFAEGVTTQTITVLVAGDTDIEPDETFVVTLSNPSGDATISTATATGVILNDDAAPTTLTISSLTALASGFTVSFSQAFNPDLLNMYDNAAGLLGPSDITLVGANVGPVKGSVVVNPNSQQFTFIKTGGPLESDTYTVTLRSAANGFVNDGGELLDGDADGTPGGDYVGTFVIDPWPADEVVVSLPDFARGFGQEVNLPNNSTTGIPVYISTGVNVSAVNFDLVFDPTLLSVSSFSTNISGAGSEFNLVEPGRMRVTLDSTNQFSSAPGTIELGRFVASVPATALYAAKQILEIQNLSVEDSDTLSRPSRADSGLHIAAFIGDSNASGTYTGGDAVLQRRVIVGSATGFVDYQLADPVIIADVNFSETLTGGDTVLLRRLTVGTPITQAPALPSGITPPPVAGPDPMLFIPTNLTADQGATITVPVRMLVTEATGISVAAMNLAIAFDPAVFAASNFLIGSGLPGLTADINSSIPGVIRVTADSTSGPLFNLNDEVTVFTFDLTVAAGAPNGPRAINLLANYGPLFTGLENNDVDQLTLIPAPTNADDDPVDGVVMIGTVVSTVELAIEAADAVKAEGNTGSTPFTFTVIRSGDTSGVTTVDYAVTGSGANPANAADFVGGVLPSGTVTFLAGITSQTITIDVAGDYVVEPDEGFVVTLSNPSAMATITSAAATGTILNDDTAGIVVDAAPNLQTKEDGSTATFTVVLTSQPTDDVVIGLSSSDVTEGTVAPGSLTFTAANWNVPQTVTVTGVDDDVVDGHVGYSIVTAAAVSADPLYSGLDADNVPLTNLDDDGIGVFGATSVVIYRVGSGGEVLLSNTGSAVFLDEYAPHGAFIQSIDMPTTASGNNRQLIASGTATSEGLLTLSGDGQFLALTGYGRDLGGSNAVNSTPGTDVPRTVAIVRFDGMINTSTALSNFASGNNPRGAYTTDGNDIWVTGAAGGVRYTTMGSTGTDSLQLSTTVVNLRGVHAYEGQLYISTSSGSAVRIGTVGAGTPTTSAQTITNLPGFPTSGSPYQFFFADLSADVEGVDTLYVADDTANQIQKYSLVAGTWAARGTITASSIRGLTGSIDAGQVTLYGTTGNTLYKFADTTGYAGIVDGSVTSIGTAAPNTAFRGVALAPQGILDTTPPDVLSLSPPDDATDVALGVNLAVTFTEDVLKGTGSILVRQSSDDAIVQTIDVANAAVIVAGAVVTIETADFPASTGLYVQIPATAFTDLAGNPFAGILDTTTWNFITAAAPDTTPPQVTTLSPENAATGVAPDANLVMTFDEDVRVGTGNIEIRLLDDHSVVQTIDVTGTAVSVAANVLSIDPPADLAFGTSYYIVIPGTAVEDLSGNAFAGFADSSGWSFTTIVNEAPTVDLNRTITMHPGQRIVISSAILLASDPESNPLTLVPVRKSLNCWFFPAQRGLVDGRR
jgi:hypothetical protein